MADDSDRNETVGSERLTELGEKVFQLPLFLRAAAQRTR